MIKPCVLSIAGNKAFVISRQQRFSPRQFNSVFNVIFNGGTLFLCPLGQMILSFSLQFLPLPHIRLPLLLSKVIFQNQPSEMFLLTCGELRTAPTKYHQVSLLNYWILMWSCVMLSWLS